VVFSNSENGEPLCWEIARSVAAEYGWDDYLIPPLERTRLTKRELKAFAGRYLLDADNVLTVDRRGDRLWAHETLTEPFELVPVSATRFVRREGDPQWDFEAPKGEISPGVNVGRRGSTSPPSRAPRAVDPIPTEDIAAGRVAEGLAALGALRVQASGEPALARDRLEDRGRTLLRHGSARAAQALLVFASGIHPGSAAIHDAMTEAHLALRQFDAAARSARAVIETVDTDPEPTASWRVVYRTRALERLAMLARRTAE